MLTVFSKSSGDVEAPAEAAQADRHTWQTWVLWRLAAETLRPSWFDEEPIADDTRQWSRLRRALQTPSKSAKWGHFRQVYTAYAAWRCLLEYCVSKLIKACQQPNASPKVALEALVWMDVLVEEDARQQWEMVKAVWPLIKPLMPGQLFGDVLTLVYSSDYAASANTEALLRVATRIPTNLKDHKARQALREMSKKPLKALLHETLFPSGLIDALSRKDRPRKGQVPLEWAFEPFSAWLMREARRYARNALRREYFTPQRREIAAYHARRDQREKTETDLHIESAHDIKTSERLRAPLPTMEAILDAKSDLLMLEHAASPQQRQIFYLLACGLTDEEIARALSIMPSTVRQHRHRLNQKRQAR